MINYSSNSNQILYFDLNSILFYHHLLMKFIQQNQTNQQTEQISLNYFEFLSFSVVILNFSKLMGPKTLS